MKNGYVIYILSGIMIILFGAFYIFSNGSPIEKYKQYKIINNYLQQKYNNNIIIKTIEYDMKQAYYFAIAYHKYHPETTFKTTIRNKGDVLSISDNYVSSMIKKEIQSNIENYLRKEKFKVKFLNIELGLAGNALQKVDMDSPRFIQIKDSLEEGNSKLNIEVSIIEDFTKLDKNAEYKRILNLIEYINAEGYKPFSLKLEYHSGSEKSSRVSFEFKYEQIIKLKTVEDVMHYENE